MNTATTSAAHAFRLQMMRERVLGLIRLSGHRFGHVGGGTRSARVDGLTVHFEGREIACASDAEVVDTLLTWGYA